MGTVIFLFKEMPPRNWWKALALLFGTFLAFVGVLWIVETLIATIFPHNPTAPIIAGWIAALPAAYMCYHYMMRIYYTHLTYKS